MVQSLASLRAVPLHVGVALLLLAFQFGCARVRQVQYFEVVSDPDPITGEVTTNFYRMSIEGNGGWGADYKLKSSYLSAATLDTLNGITPVIPEADLTKESQETLQKIKSLYLEKLTDYAQAERDRHAGTSDEQTRRVLQIARQAWYASMSDQDIFGLGQVQSANPYRFRKLVFYATAENLDLNLDTYEQQVSSAIDKTTKLARHFKEIRDEKEKANKSRMAVAKRLLKESNLDASVKALIPILFPGIETGDSQDNDDKEDQ